MKTLKIVLLGLFGSGFLTYFYLHNPNTEPGHFLACPFKTLTGWDCPGCGSQRLIYNLLHFNFAEALHDNALLFVSFPFVLYILFVFIANQFFGSHYRIKIFYKNWFIMAVLVLFVSFGVLRNLPFEPFIQLASPK